MYIIYYNKKISYAVFESETKFVVILGFSGGIWLLSMSGKFNNTK